MFNHSPFCRKSLLSSQTCYLGISFKSAFLLLLSGLPGFDYGPQCCKCDPTPAPWKVTRTMKRCSGVALPLEHQSRQFSSCELFVETKQAQPIPASKTNLSLPNLPTIVKSSIRWSSPELSQVQNYAWNLQNSEKKKHFPSLRVLECLVYTFQIPALRR